ncbi:M56 family metallopeptidase [Pedobacter sp.]
MNWLYYLLEANLYLAVFYFMYKLLLQRSTFYNSNRYFLVFSIAAAFTIPLIQLGFLKPQLLLQTETISYEMPLETLEISVIAKPPTLTAQDYIFYGYLLLAMFLGLKFMISISKIVKIYLNSKKRKLNDYTLVELRSEHTAFSFFNILFIHPTMAKNDAVLRHEIVHIREKHSWDILLLELLKICCWFNPIVYLMKKDVTLLHEYIADEKTTDANITKHEYAMFLIENSMAAYSSSLVNQLFNQSILKSRINMLNKKKTANWARLKYLLAIPLGAGLLCVSTLSFSKSYGYDVFPLPQQVIKDKPITKEKQKYYPKYKHDKNGNYISLEDRLIVVNGKIITDKNKYYGTADADKIVFLNSANAIKKYGSEKGKNGAVEIYGENVVHTFPPPVIKTAVQKDQVKLPPPRIQYNKKDQIKFPPPVVKLRNQSSFYPANAYRNKKAIKVDSRLIVINGEIVTDNSTFYGVANTESVVLLNPKHAEEKYGTKARYGAVEITGRNLNKLPLAEPPPIEPPPTNKKVKIPPTPALNPEKPSVEAQKDQTLQHQVNLKNKKSDQATMLDGSKMQTFYMSSNTNEIKMLKAYNELTDEIRVSKNYNSDWDGLEGNINEFTSKELESGTYYYLVKNKNTGSVKNGIIQIR